MSPSPPRYAPNVALPPYSYVTGRNPHPLREPAGHGYGRTEPSPDRPDPARPGNSLAFLSGVDLFNHGYYWEAHEAWESLWIACERVGVEADFLKALIKLAAAGVMSRRGRVSGVVRHAARAEELIELTARRLPEGTSEYFGLNLRELARFAEMVRQTPIAEGADRDQAVRIVFDFALRPQVA